MMLYGFISYVIVLFQVDKLTSDLSVLVQQLRLRCWFCKVCREKQRIQSLAENGGGWNYRGDLLQDVALVTNKNSYWKNATCYL